MQHNLGMFILFSSDIHNFTFGEFHLECIMVMMYSSQYKMSHAGSPTPHNDPLCMVVSRDIQVASDAMLFLFVFCVP